MNLYTDYYAPAGGISTDEAKTVLSNVAADMLVTYCVFSLVKHADTNISSSSSNYAEISKDGFNIRIYCIDDDGHGPYLAFGYYYTGESTCIVQWYTRHFQYNLKYPNAYEVKLRVFNCKTGITYFQIGCDTYGLATPPAIARCTRISTGEEKIILLTGLGTNDCYLNGDTSSLKIPTLNGLYDADGVGQVLTPVGVIVKSSAGCRYILKDFYQSGSYKYIGSVQIGDRYFYIPDYGYTCFECNAPS